MRTDVIGGALVLTLDRVTKIWAFSRLRTGTVDVLPGILSFTYAENTGMAFSLLAGHPRLLAVVSLGMIILLAWGLRRVIRRTPLSDAMLGAIIGGGLGNAFDRIFYGYVIDFIEPRFMRFAIFNVADIAVTIGALALIVLSFWDYTEEKQIAKQRDERE